MTSKQIAFLAAYAECGNVTEAASAAGVGRRTHYDWLTYPEYAIAFLDAEEEAVERLEGEARRRAVDGAREPVIYQGRLCFDVARDKDTGDVIYNDEGQTMLSDTPLTIPRKSDILLMFMLKAKRPEKYRDNASITHSGPGGAPISLEVAFVKVDKAA